MSTKLQQLRSLHSDFARAYKYDIKTYGPKEITLPDLQTNELGRSCLGIPIPSEGVQLIEVEIGLNTMRLHGRAERGGTITPEFILSGDFSIYKYFRAWKQAAVPDGLAEDEIQTPSGDLLANWEIIAKNVQNKTSLSVRIGNIWCRNAPEIPLADDSNDIIRWSPELVYEYTKVI